MSPPAPLNRQLAGIFAALESPLISLPASVADTARKPAKRAKLWELQDKHHCPVIGTCLAIDELARIARRYSFAGDLRDEFSLHTEAVGHARSRNAVAEAIQKHLERKYRIQIIRFERAGSDAEVLALWRQHYARGDVAGALWAALTHKAASDETRQRIYADVHMLSHQVGAGQAADAHRLAHLEKEYAAVRGALEQQKKEQARGEAELRKQLQNAVAELDRLRPNADEAAALRARLEAYESGSAIVDIGRKLLSLQAANEQLLLVAQRGRPLEKALRLAHDEALALAGQRDRLAAERDALERLLLTDGVDSGKAKDCDGDCSRCELAASSRCVLCVGGRSSLLAQYRALAERLGIRLIHHDGGLEEALSRLPDMISGADAVICPTDCVSHAAYYQLKRQCKRSGKPCLLFKGAGVSAFAVALARLSAGRVSLPGTPIRLA